MRRLSAWTATGLLVSFATVATVPEACAEPSGPAQGITARYPTDAIEFAAVTNGVDTAEQALQLFLQSDGVGRIVFERGTHRFDTTLFVFGREDLVLCGETGDARDVIVVGTNSSGDASPEPPVFQVQRSRRIQFRDLTVTAEGDSQTAIRLVATSSLAESFVEDVRIRDCDLRAFVGISGSVGARNVVVRKCSIRVNEARGVGILWEDGEGLFVNRTQFSTEDVFALAAVFVRGAATSLAAGRRARKVVLTRNTVAGNFGVGLDLSDVVDCRVRKNRIVFEDSRFVDGTSGRESGRVGILVRRAAAPDPTTRFELLKNDVTLSHYGIWLLNTSQGRVRKNDLRGCGSPAADERFQDSGGAMLVTLLTGLCTTRIERNDFRKLLSPGADPAVTILGLPEGASDLSSCLDAADRNKTGGGRTLVAAGVR